jgi:hypothetical protein
LHECGVVLLPFWICDYRLHGQQYRAFLDDMDSHGCVVGPTHVDKATTQVQFIINGGVVGVAIAAAAKTPLALVAIPMFTAIGYALGNWSVSTRAAVWEDAGSLRNEERKVNDQWETQAYWQQQMRNFATDWQQRERRRYEQHQPREQQPAEEHEVFPDWRYMDDYQILGLHRGDFEQRSNSYTTNKQLQSNVGSAFRAQAMSWHPDHHMDKDAKWQGECTERFRRIVRAHQALRKRWAVDR